jgi:hypothetical protein
LRAVHGRAVWIIGQFWHGRIAKSSKRDEPKVGAFIEARIREGLHHRRQAQPLAIKARDAFQIACSAKFAVHHGPVTHRRWHGLAELNPAIPAQRAKQHGKRGAQGLETDGSLRIGDIRADPFSEIMPQIANRFLRLHQVQKAHIPLLSVDRRDEIAQRELHIRLVCERLDDRDFKRLSNTHAPRHQARGISQQAG